MGVPGCSETGQVQIELILPEDAALSPAGDRLAEITLVTWGEGEPLQRDTHEVEDPSRGVEMGALPAGVEVQVALELRAASGRLIGYGRAPGTVSAQADGDTIIPIHVRRPYIYASGAADRLETFDSTLDPGEDGTYGSLDLPAPVASAATPDGAELVVVSALGETDSLLRVIETRTHVALQSAPVPLGGGVSDVAISADGALALVAHDGEAGGVSVVDLEAARGGQAQVTFVPAGAAGAVVAVAGGDGRPALALALLARARAFGCDEAAPASSLAVVELDDAPALDATVTLPSPVADLAAAPDGSTVYLAEPCADAVTALAIDAGVSSIGQPEELMPLELAGAVAVQGDRLLAAGSLPPDGSEGARLVLVQAGLDGVEPVRTLLPPGQVRAQSVDFEGDDQTVEVVIDADQLRPADLVGLPGGEMVALLQDGYYHSEEWIDIFGDTVVAELEVETVEYQLIDVSNRATVHRLRTFCEVTPLTSGTLQDFTCAKEPGQDVHQEGEMYRASQLSTLYGGR